MERSHVKKCAKADLEKKRHPVTDSKKNTRNWTLVSEIGHYCLKSNTSLQN